MDHVVLDGGLRSLALTELLSEELVLLTEHLVVALEISDNLIVLADNLLARECMCPLDLVFDQSFMHFRWGLLVLLHWQRWSCLSELLVGFPLWSCREDSFTCLSPVLLLHCR